MTLDQWLARHGPIATDVATVVALDSCARASRMTSRELAAAIGSLSVTGITRSATGRWAWTASGADSRPHGVSDVEVVERLGAILFHCVTGGARFEPFAGEHVVRTRLRALRPDLPPAVADITVRALSSAPSSYPTLDAFARAARHTLGIAADAERPRRRRRLAAGSALATAAALIAAMWWANLRSRDPIESHGFTSVETALIDVTVETAHGFAMMDEHTAAIQEYGQLGRWLTARLPPEDPRLAWNAAHDGWIRTLRGDRLTTEQVLGVANGVSSRLDHALGERHPYARAARLELAATLDARKATHDAAALREHADVATHALIGDASVVLAGVPAPAGVVAHLAPNVPEREGFRRDDGGFFVPLTSIQRWLAGRDGWRLHVIADGGCRASVVVGNVPRRFAVTTSRTAGEQWQITIEGTKPPLTLALSGGRAIVSLMGDGTNTVAVRLPDGRTQPVQIDDGAAPPVPPYTLSYANRAGLSDCALVWLEIPVPFEPKS